MNTHFKCFVIERVFMNEHTETKCGASTPLTGLFKLVAPSLSASCLPTAIYLVFVVRRVQGALPVAQ